MIRLASFVSILLTLHATSGLSLRKKGAFSRRVFAFTLAGGAHQMFSSNIPGKMDSKSTRKMGGSPLPFSSSSPSPTSLSYRIGDDDMMVPEYTDTLWHAALRSNEVFHVDAATESSLVVAMEDTNTPFELRPDPTNKNFEKDHEDSLGSLVEAAKAFIPVAIEVGLVAGVASNVNFLR